jgi:phosphate transport system protein
MRRLDTDLEQLNQQLLEMSSLVASSVQRSVRSLIDKNEMLAHQVIRDEARIDQMEIQIDDLATSLVALTQPVARDMRFIVVAIKINTDLERMGDLAVGIVERSLSLMHQPQLEIAKRIPDLSQLVESMVLLSLDSFVKRDADAAREIMRADDRVDNERNAIIQELIAAMQKDGTLIPQAIDLITVARNLERIADHATNIAEEVIFMVKGEDVRHAAPVPAAS